MSNVIPIRRVSEIASIGNVLIEFSLGNMTPDTATRSLMAAGLSEAGARALVESKQRNIT